MSNIIIDLFLFPFCQLLLHVSWSFLIQLGLFCLLGVLTLLLCNVLFYHFGFLLISICLVYLFSIILSLTYLVFLLNPFWQSRSFNCVFRLFTFNIIIGIFGLKSTIHFLLIHSSYSFLLIHFLCFFFLPCFAFMFSLYCLPLDYMNF